MNVVRKFNYRPIDVQIGDLIADPQVSVERMDRLQALGVLVPTSTLKDQLRFAIDPLSEYLAALHLIDTCREDTAMWHGFLKQVEELVESEITIRGFVIAMHDCCVNSSMDVPPHVIAALQQHMRHFNDVRHDESEQGVPSPYQLLSVTKAA